jgi:ABC-type phosphate transport system substrate-binding protein
MQSASRIRRPLSVLLLLAALLAPSATSAFAQGVSIGGPFDGEASSLTGGGATFPAPLYQQSDPCRDQLSGDRLGRWHTGHSAEDV